MILAVRAPPGARRTGIQALPRQGLASRVLVTRPRPLAPRISAWVPRARVWDNVRRRSGAIRTTVALLAVASRRRATRRSPPAQSPRTRPVKNRRAIASLRAARMAWTARAGLLASGWRWHGLAGLRQPSSGSCRPWAHASDGPRHATSQMATVVHLPAAGLAWAGQAPARVRLVRSARGFRVPGQQELAELPRGQCSQPAARRGGQATWSATPRPVQRR